MKKIHYILIAVGLMAVAILITLIAVKQKKANDLAKSEEDALLDDEDGFGGAERVSYLGAWTKGCVQGKTCRTPSGLIGTQSHTATGCRCQRLQTVNV